MTQTTFLGYEVEKVSTEPGKVAYRLHGPRTIYRLMRNQNGTMYAIRANGNVCGIKGNYHFSDGKGELRCLYS